MRWNFFWRVCVRTTRRRRVLQSHESTKSFSREYHTKFYVMSVLKRHKTSILAPTCIHITLYCFISLLIVKTNVFCQNQDITTFYALIYVIFLIASTKTDDSFWRQVQLNKQQSMGLNSGTLFVRNKIMNFIIHCI